MEQYYSQRKVVKIFNISTKTLEAMRYKGTGPRYFKFGRKVLYSESDLNTYLQKNHHRSTSEY